MAVGMEAQRLKWKTVKGIVDCDITNSFPGKQDSSRRTSSEEMPGTRPIVRMKTATAVT